MKQLALTALQYKVGEFRMTSVLSVGLKIC